MKRDNAKKLLVFSFFSASIMKIVSFLALLGVTIGIVGKFGTSSWQFTFAIGLLLLHGAYYTYLKYQQDSQKRKQLQVRGLQTQGIVIGNKFILSRIASSFRPIIHFQTQEGTIIEAVDYSGWAMAIPRFTKGTRITVRYDPVDPTNFERL